MLINIILFARIITSIGDSLSCVTLNHIDYHSSKLKSFGYFALFN